MVGEKATPEQIRVWESVGILKKPKRAMNEKLYIFRPRGTMDFIEIIASSPMLAIRQLIQLHGKRAYQIINVTTKRSSYV
jgi:hypothetical protein